MNRKIHETFSNDIRYNSEIISMEDLSVDISEQEQKTVYYNKEELDLIWSTLKDIYDITDEHYIVMYLIFYLGFSYRKAAVVIGRVHTSCVFYVDQAINEVKERIANNEKREIEQIP